MDRATRVAIGAFTGNVRVYIGGRKHELTPEEADRLRSQIAGATAQLEVPDDE